MDRGIVLAYDGSINADWVSRYAIQMAATLPCRQLLLVHILDGTFAHSRIEERFAAIASECLRHDIACQTLIQKQGGDVFSSLLQVIPPGAQTYCLCGARVAPKGRGFLAGTISERLLRCRKFNVLAIRVVSHGLLGCPPALLFPLAGHPRGFQAAMPFLQLLAVSVKKLHLLRVMTVNPLHFRYISPVASQKKIAEGYEYLSLVATEIRAQTAGFDWHFNRNVVISDNWVKEILIQAGKVNAAMILLGATDRGLPSLFFRGNRLEQILRDTACDVGIYRSV